MQPNGKVESDERVYAEAIKAHAKHALVLYKAKIPQLERLSGLHFEPDGSNTARTVEDIQHYLTAIKAVGGQVASISAKLLLANTLLKLGHPRVHLE